MRKFERPRKSRLGITVVWNSEHSIDDVIGPDGTSVCSVREFRFFDKNGKISHGIVNFGM